MIFRLLQIAIPFIWFGLVGGISFMEAPLKFQAPNITVPLALGIGRIVFFTLNKIEIVLAVLMLISFIKIKPKGNFAPASFAVIALLVILETVWLLPVLDARAIEVINGSVQSPSNLHFIYIVFDAVKFVLLFALGTSIAKSYLRLE